MKLHELYAQVTGTIIKDLEGGVATWVKPWKSGAVGRQPDEKAGEIARIRKDLLV
jgi:antirestriction protein ArdC